MSDQSEEIKNQIINILRINGPLLPVQISKEIKKDSLITSALLSELLANNVIYSSNMKIGSSCLYLLNNQKEKLEGFSKYLKPIEKDAMELLKEKKFLKDSEQEPAIRFALRNIKDFSIPFKKNEELYWRYFKIPLKEIENEINPKKEVIKKPKNKIEQIKKQVKTNQIEFQNPLIIKKTEKRKKESEFVIKTKEFLEKNNFKIIKELELKKNNYKCIIEINSELGKIKFMTLAKDKKTISELDLKKLVSESQKIPLPALIVYTGKLSKKAKEFTEKYDSIIKEKKLINDIYK